MKKDEGCIDATGNWWGSPEGPNTEFEEDENECGCDEADNANNSVNDGIDFCDFSTQPWFDLICEEQEDAITLENFRANAVDKDVLLEWKTGTEIDNLGFFLVRGENENYTLLNKDMIPAMGSAYSGHSYRYLDNTVQSGHAYSYWLADLDIFGMLTIHGPVNVITNLERIELVK